MIRIMNLVFFVTVFLACTWELDAADIPALCYALNGVYVQKTKSCFQTYSRFNNQSNEMNFYQAYNLCQRRTPGGLAGRLGFVVDQDVFSAVELLYKGKYDYIWIGGKASESHSYSTDIKDFYWTEGNLTVVDCISWNPAMNQYYTGIDNCLISSTNYFYVQKCGGYVDSGYSIAALCEFFDGHLVPTPSPGCTIPTKAPPPCCENGIVYENKCYCEKGWVGDCCQVQCGQTVTPTVCCVHGIVENGFCFCSPGFFGPCCGQQITTTTAQSTTPCCINGVYFNGVCYCSNTWTGACCNIKI